MKKTHEKLMLGKIYHELTEEELTLFNQLMDQDAKFKNEYEIIEQMFSNLKDKKTEGIRSKLNAIYKERHGSKRKTIMIKQKWYSVAATVAALIMVGAFWYSSLNNKGWNEEVFQKYYEEDEVFINTRSKVNFDVDVLHHGMELLEKKDFTGALSEFNKLPKSVTANYYAGVANMELKDHIAAIAKFDYVIKDYLNLFYDQAQWYKGLCLVKLERKEEAVALFSQITKTESYFKEKAKQIERDLKSE